MPADHISNSHVIHTSNTNWGQRGAPWYIPNQKGISVHAEYYWHTAVNIASVQDRLHSSILKEHAASNNEVLLLIRGFER